MSANNAGDLEQEEPSRRTVLAPYSSHHPVPTVQKYNQVQQERRREERLSTGQGREDEPDGFRDKVKRKLGLSSSANDRDQPYQSSNRNEVVPPTDGVHDEDGDSEEDEDDDQKGEQNGDYDTKEAAAAAAAKDAPQDTTESNVATGDARQKRKAMKKRQPKGTRLVTDPVTHLQMAIHDFTGKELDKAPENFEAPGALPRTDTSGTKSEDDIAEEQEELHATDPGTRRIFPPPSFDTVRDGLLHHVQKALLIWITVVSALSASFIAYLWLSFDQRPVEQIDGARISLSWSALAFVISILVAAAITGITLHSWLINQVRRSWDDDVWQAARREERKQAESPAPESTQWLNRLLASIWPLINPDLFVAISDLVEDVMQASLPRFVRMVAVEDLGQGSESIRILGIRWLPTGAASKSVDLEGKVKKDKPGQENDRNVPGKGELQREDSGDDETEQQDQEQQNIAEGLEKEEGEFVNLEVGFAYRARENDKRLSKRAKNAHLLIKFYLPGSLPIPIWVTLQGFVGVMRARLQLTPDPPFVALATVTLVGQPKAEMQAIPLTKHFLNVMDLPFISGFVQSSIDAALAEYVAPKSLTLNIKEMLMGDDFKKDTNARGVIIVHIKQAYGFKEADFSIPGIKQGSADPYVTVGWAKFGKPVWSTRVIVKTMHPVWDEAAFLLVTPEELNAEERLRIQLWDSDRITADDDVGRIELDLKEIMHKDSRGKMWERKDGFVAMQGKEKMPGQLEWSVGYFPKVRLTPKQIKQQKVIPDVNDRQALKDAVNDEAEKKMREASKKDMSDEIEQNKEAGLVEKEISMAAAAPPPEGFPTGIFSIQLHNITGLNLQVLGKSRDQYNNEGAEGTEVSDDLPSAYAVVIINGQKIFKTRTKPKNAKPFFNASTERAIRDWRHTEVMVSVRDARVHEDDALMGLVYLNLGDVFAKRSQVDGAYPLVGGVGFGRFRISMVFRACTLQLPREYLGWEYGTLEITKARTEDLPSDLLGMRLKFKGPLGKGRLHGEGGAGKEWSRRRHTSLMIGVAHRYSSCLTVEFRKTVSGPDKTAAFGIFWLKDIADGEGRTVDIPIWRGGRSKAFDRARTSAIEECSEEKIGSLKVDMKLWPGLSEYHRGLASKNVNLHNVMEVLDTARDNDLVKTELYSRSNPKDSHDDDENGDKKKSDDSDDSDQDSSDDDKDNEEITMINGDEYYDYDGVSEADRSDVEEPDSLKDSKPPQERGRDNEHNEEDDGSRGPIEQIKDFSNHRKTLHRQHRGAMQWQVPRTVKWLKHKAEASKDKIVGAVAHHDREPGIETEV